MRLLKSKSSLIYLVVLVTSTMIFLTDCQEPIEEVPIPEVGFNPDFTRNPPIADNVFIQKLEKPTKAGNFLLTAEFSGQELEKLSNQSFFAMQRGDEKIVLRNDGKGGDKEANDNTFSVILKEDESILEDQIDRVNEQIGQISTNDFQWFEARKVVQTPDINRINKDAFLENKLVNIGEAFKVPFFVSGPVQDHSLMIIDLDVVEDPTRTITDPCTASPGDENRAWTFGKLMTDMANEPMTGVNVSDFTLKWLESWTIDNTVNGDLVQARNTINNLIITPWKTASNFSTTGTLAMEKAPFKLIAIVNRIDLKSSSFYGGGNAGEGRFIFAAMDASCNVLDNFTVIFEYGVNIKGCSNVKAYAQSWHDLKNLTLGSAAYNTALQAITDQFALANASPSKPNGSSLNQLRTNEIALSGPWELREFVICNPSLPEIATCNPGNLVITTTKREANSEYNRKGPGANPARVKELGQWANANATAILAENFDIPLELNGNPFLGGHAPTPGGHFWDGELLTDSDPIMNHDVRHKLSLNSCSGCHSGETGTQFTHIKPNIFTPGAPAIRSGFLTGISVTDPASIDGRPATSRSFNDLQRRENELVAIVNSTCGSIFDIAVALKTPVLKFVH